MSDPAATGPASLAPSPATSPGTGQAGLTSVVVVTADSGDGVADCIARVLASTTATEVIVSDNASSDGSIECIAARFVANPQVRILHNGKNLGFGAACNRATAIARGAALVLLNPDCLVETDTLARLRAVLDADACIGLVGASQLDAAGQVDPASKRRDPLLWPALMRVSGLTRFAKHSTLLSGFELPASSAAVEPVDAVSGALMLLPLAVYRQVQGFDEGYFLHCEDLDLCRRIRDAGLRVVCANDVSVLHGKGGSSRHRPVFVAWHKHRGMWRWFSKFDPAARNPLLRAVVWLGIWTRFALKLPLMFARRLLPARTA